MDAQILPLDAFCWHLYASLDGTAHVSRDRASILPITNFRSYGRPEEQMVPEEDSIIPNNNLFLFFIENLVS
ncbi:hypothetical protein [Qipengyuania spongiae]|uniref:Uncharacterized protein n=1 Tax=Qipengyuania spongiae TaxID=2909673 RepID=A0ABY5SYR3_9SPHN|nr:hypothetical protein [Qipengyuania spongiae]UVI39667.1 hypothetical protein L1F33_01505 [Qipengyuania spongiae]